MQTLVKKLTDLLGQKRVSTGDAIGERATSYWDPSGY
jgi:hypothetical protein